MNKKNVSTSAAPTPIQVPLALRVGGAFMALAVVLGLWTFLDIATHGWMAPFAVTIRFLLICVAAMMIGGTATAGRTQYITRARMITLGLALLLLVLSRVVPNTVVMVMAQYWLPSYAIVALLASLFLRRSLIPA